MDCKNKVLLSGVLLLSLPLTYTAAFAAKPLDLTQQKISVFEKGAGKIGNYGRCAWEVLGEGQFMPLTGSHATIGEENRLEKVREYKIEMVCDDKFVQDVIAAMKQAHPYEEPAYQVWKVENI